MASLMTRGKTYYAQYYLGGKQKRVCLNTTLQIAKEKLRQIESSLIRGTQLPLPTKTSIGDVVATYVDYLYTVKTPKSTQRDIYYPQRDLWSGLSQAGA